MLQDALGNPVSTDDPWTVRAVDVLVGEFLGYRKNFAVILDAVKRDPGCCVANAMAAQLMLFLEQGDSKALARPYLDAAQASAPKAGERERAFLEIVEAAARDDGARGTAIARTMADRWPRDLNANKFGQYLAFNRGDLATMLDLVERVLPANADNHYVHGMLAFGYEQTNRLREAEAAGRKAVEFDRRDPWAHHAVAHVMLTEGRTREGLAWMGQYADTWTDCNSFMLTHNWWHVALFHIDLDQPTDALALYDRWVWGQDKSYSQDQVNAISLLWRLELAGISVGARWRDVAEHVAGRTKEHVLPFLDLHYGYALARAGRDAKVEEMKKSLAAHAARTGGVWRDAALPAFRGLIAHARKGHAEAAAALGPVQPLLQSLGGSHAQRDLFVETWIDATLKAGAGSAILPTLEARRRARPGIAWHERDLARARASP